MLSRRRASERVEAEEDALPRGVVREAVPVPCVGRVDRAPQCGALERVLHEEGDEGEVGRGEWDRPKVKGDELGEGRGGHCGGWRAQEVLQDQGRVGRGHGCWEA